ncbi:MAG: hypothetical protein H6815_10295 [Phycisphaeraceae bacterium]|nr:hypothetical protein [Phycisphaerales bacterium]MCB9860829.1 hypothetical protein [Phycisphaeraceae bacterium]
MLKLIRKYKTFLLVVFGIGLMLIYLLPQGLARAGGGRGSKGPAIGTLDGKAIHRNVLDRAHAELQLVKNLIGSGFMTREMNMLATMWDLDPSDAEHWMLLTQAAEKGGFVGETGDGRNFIDSMLVAMNRPTTDIDRTNLIRQFASTLNMRTEKDVLESIADINGVIRMFGSYASTVRVSAPAVTLDAKESQDRATVTAVYIPGAAAIDPTTWKPTEEELQAHFEKFRNTKPTEGEFGIGYLLPNRIKLEILEVNAQAIRDGIVPDRIEVRKEYDKNRSMYTGDFETHRTEIEIKLKDKVYDDVVATIRRAVRAESYNSIDALKKSADGYRILPDDWAEHMPSLSAMTGAIVQQVKDELNIYIPEPVVTTTPTLMTLNDIAQDTTLQSVTTMYSGREIPLASVLFNAKEFDPPTDIGVQAGIPLIDFEGRRGNGDMLIVTILDAVEESPATTLEEVRTKVENDLRSVSGYEILKSSIDDIKQQALSGGLTSLTESYPSADFPVVIVNDAVVTRTSVTGTESRLRDEVFAEAVIDLAATVDPLKLIEEVPVEERTLAVAIPKQLGVGAARIQSITPLTNERLRLASWNTMTKLRIEGLGFDGTDPDAPSKSGFAYDALAQRLNWQPKPGISRRNQDESDDQS